jgi:hypothetical protein
MKEAMKNVPLKVGLQSAIQQDLFSLIISKVLPPAVLNSFDFWKPFITLEPRIIFS